MKMAQMFPSSWLKKEDCPRPVMATIHEVTIEEVAGDGGKEQKAVLRFRGDVKPMILNRGNAETLSMAWGDDSTAWHGRTVEIYVDPSVMFAGKRTGGLRLRVPAGGPPMNGQAPVVWTYQQAIEECAKVGITKDMLVNGLKVAGQGAWNNARCTPIVQQLIAQQATPSEPDVPFDDGSADQGFGEDPNGIPF